MVDTARVELLNVLASARAALARPENDFSWSSWNGVADAVGEVDTLIADLQNGILPKRLDVDILFACTGPIQEVSLSSGWADAFLVLAKRSDDALDALYGVEGA